MPSARRRAVVYTEDAYAGGDRWFLDRLNPDVVTRVTGLHWSTTCPGGDTLFRADLTAPPGLEHVALHAGRRVYVMCGGSTRWSGFLDEPHRGQPWQLSGPGLAAMAKTWGGASNYARGLDAVVDDAIGRGLPWTRPASINSGTHVPVSTTLDAVLNDVCKANGLVWTLSPAGQLTAFSVPKTAIDYTLDTREPLNPTLQGVTQVLGFYNGSSQVAVSNAAAQQKFGKREGTYDMSSLTSASTISSTNATSYATAWLNANLASWRYANSLTVYPGQLKVPGGGPVDLATVRAGCNVLLTNVDPSHQSLLTPGQMTMFVGGTDYDADNDTLTLTPVGMRGQDLLSVIYQATGGA